MTKITLLFFILACSILAPAQTRTDYIGEIEKWRADHEAEIKAENGWLTVAGLFWLHDGVNTVGSGDTNNVILTENFKQGRFGEIELTGGKAILKINDGVDATSDGKPFRSIELVSDEKGKPTVVETGSQTFYLIKREDRLGVRLKDKASPKRVNFAGLHWFPVNKKYKVTARFVPFPTPKEVLIPNVLGGNFKMQSPGLLKFKVGGKEYTLQPVTEEDHLFIIFRDLSSRKDTYAAGRFLYSDAPLNGKVTLDFNKAENPPCAFTSFATCPLPPAQNRLAVEINAGEKRFDH